MPLALPHQLAHQRKARLQQRCEQERQQLGVQMQVIDAAVRRGDALFNTVRGFVSRPVVLAAGAMMLFLRRRTSVWGLLSRGAVLLATARRVYTLIKR